MNKNAKYDYLKAGSWKSSQFGTHAPLRTRREKSRSSFGWVSVMLVVVIAALMILYYVS